MGHRVPWWMFRGLGETESPEAQSLLSKAPRQGYQSLPGANDPLREGSGLTGTTHHVVPKTVDDALQGSVPTHRDRHVGDRGGELWAVFVSCKRKKYGEW